MDPGAPPPTDSKVPPEPAPPASESAQDRHRREMEASFEALEVTVEHGFVRVLKIAVLVVVGVMFAGVGTYVLGGYLRDRGEQQRIARATLSSYQS